MDFISQPGWTLERKNEIGVINENKSFNNNNNKNLSSGNLEKSDT